MKNPIALVIVTAITVLGLVILQVTWLKTTIDLSEQEFDKTVTQVVLPMVAFEYIRNPSLRIDFDKQRSHYLERIRSGEEVRIPMKSVDHQVAVTRTIIDSLFQSHGIEMEAVFGIYGYETKKFWFSSDSSYQKKLLDSKYKDCFSCAVSIEDQDVLDTTSNTVPTSLNARRSIDQILSDPNADKSDLQIIAVHFPLKSSALFGKIRSQLIVAAILIFVLIGCFLYSIYIFKSQKKISVIKNDFINNLTHELKTPIASILLSTKVLDKSKTAQLSLEDQQFLRLIQNEGKRLENHVDRVLQVAMVDSGNFSLDKEKVDLHSIIDNVVSSLQMIIDQRQAEVSLSLDASNHMIEGDEAHLFNLCYNLLENALKYSDESPKVSIATENSDGQICLKVEDQGIGMSPEVQGKIFDRFYRGQTGDRYKENGFGLGLSYVKSIVKQHQGRILLRSEPGRGTSFKVMLNNIVYE